MATAWRQDLPPHIDLQPWEVLEIDGQRYGVKSLFEDASYEFLVTDFCRIWEEYLTENDIAARAKVREWRFVNSSSDMQMR